MKILTAGRCSRARMACLKFLHSADWQIGARFRQFGDQAGRLGEARLRTLRRALEEAEMRSAEAFLIAGDLFEDNQVGQAAVAGVFDLFAEFAGVPILILPGNHDPFTGPASIWGRRPFATPPPHLKVFTAPEARALGDGWIVANPLTQKRSTIDPSRRLADLAATLPASAIKLGMTHGSPVIESRYQPDDHPIALDAASRAGLDYLALGHWHSKLLLDGDRMMMPGTPEPTDFAEHGAGWIYEVEIARQGEPPKITPIHVAEWRWVQSACDLTDAARARSDAEAMLHELVQQGAPSAIWRLALRGSAHSEAAAEFERSLRERAGHRVLLEVRNETAAELGEAELEAICREHPLVGQVLEDLAALVARASGEFTPVMGDAGFSAAEFEALCERIGRAPKEMTPEFIAAARRLLCGELREAAERC
jgi:DNA repair exonuclease SbcCD nuclease subunit